MKKFFSVLLLISVAVPAYAEWSPGELPLNPALHSWFMKQHSKEGIVCCDEGDGAPADAWGVESGGYWVEIYGRRFHVDDKEVDQDANIMGVPIVWTFPLGSKSPLGVRCFLPGAMG